MNVKELHEKEFDKAVSTKKVVIIDFYANWCGPCKRLKPILEEVAEEGVIVYSVDVDHNRELASRFDVSSIPTVLLFKDGKQVDMFVGLKDKDEILELVEDHS